VQRQPLPDSTQETCSEVHAMAYLDTMCRFLSSGGGMGAGVHPSMQVLAFLADRAVKCDRVPLEGSAPEHAAIQLSLQDLQDSMLVARKVAAAIDNKRSGAQALLPQIHASKCLHVLASACTCSLRMCLCLCACLCMCSTFIF
jgi:hypothetical protein